MPHLFAVSAVAASILAAPIVGVLEDPQCKDDAPRAIRPLFVKSKEKWEPLSSAESARPFLQSNMAWTAILGGKHLGTLRSGDVVQPSGPDWTYPRDFLLSPNADNALPTIANKSKQFMGWCAAPTHVPVPITTRDSAIDPEQWVPRQPKSEMREKVYHAFRKSIRGMKLCYVKEDSVSELYNFTSKDIRILQVLGNNRGRILVAATLKKDYTECESELGEANTPRWFLMDSVATFLGEGLEYIDAGDYDRDGETELLFWYSDYNRDGYVLFSKAFKERVEYTWNYH